jgi:hypothetical protein
VSGAGTGPGGVRVADINDRLERLSRRDELARRARERAVPRSVPGVGPDFMEVVEAVAAVVRRHPGMSVMLAPADGRRRSAVIRVTERHCEAEVAPVTMANLGDAAIGPAPSLGQPNFSPAYGLDPGPPPDPGQADLSRPDLARPDLTRPDLSRPDLTGPAGGPPDPGYRSPDPSHGQEQPGPWRPPAEPARPQPGPGPYENAPAEGWGWER